MPEYIFGNQFHSLKLELLKGRLRVQYPEDLDGWTFTMIFDEPQTFEVFSSDANLFWNCKRNMLHIQVK